VNGQKVSSAVDLQPPAPAVGKPTITASEEAVEATPLVEQTHAQANKPNKSTSGSPSQIHKQKKQKYESLQPEAVIPSTENVSIPLPCSNRESIAAPPAPAAAPPEAPVAAPPAPAAAPLEAPVAAPPAPAAAPAEKSPVHANEPVLKPFTQTFKEHSPAPYTPDLSHLDIKTSEQTTAESMPITVNDILIAQARIESMVHVTPIATCDNLDAIATEKLHSIGGKAKINLLLKCENMQKVGAFKARGACNAVQMIKAAGTTQAVITHSSGNHGQALAYAARRAGIPCTVVVPRGSPQCKVDAMKEYGAELQFCRNSQEDREDTCRELMDDARIGGRRLEMVHPYEDPRVMAGQGVIGLEFLQQMSCIVSINYSLPFLQHAPAIGLNLAQLPQIHAVIVPLGGGGMLSGIATVFQQYSPQTIIIAAEPMNANDGFRSMQSLRGEETSGPELPDGRRGFLDGQPKTVADGLRTLVGKNPFKIISKHVEVVVQVSEAAIIQATKLCFERTKLVVEPSAGVGLAVALGLDGPVLAEILKKRFPRSTEYRVAVILCGGNVDVSALPF